MGVGECHLAALETLLSAPGGTASEFNAAKLREWQRGEKGDLRLTPRHLRDFNEPDACLEVITSQETL